MWCRVRRLILSWSYDVVLCGIGMVSVTYRKQYATSHTINAAHSLSSN